VAYRVALAGSIVFACLRAWRRRSPEAMVFASSAFLLLLNGQWGQATTLGSSVIAGGLALAAASHMGHGRSKSARKIGARRRSDPVNVPVK